MLDAVFVDDLLGVSAGVEDSAEDLLELFVEAPDTEGLKVEVFLEKLVLLDNI